MAYRLSLKSRILMRDRKAVDEKAPRSFRATMPVSGNPPSKVRCILPSGRLAYKVNEDLGKSMHKEGIGEGVFSRKGRLICIKLKSGEDRIAGGVRYVTDAPSDKNPPNVWMLIPITHMPRSIFMQVQTDCLR